jgi:hypothetical protein
MHSQQQCYPKHSTNSGVSVTETVVWSNFEKGSSLALPARHSAYGADLVGVVLGLPLLQ